jgi:membrane protein YqaA with SNARE-associated domain
VESYLGLFLTAFLSATLLPGGSEILFAGLLAAGYDHFALWTWATIGNSLGSALNWLLGRYLLRFSDRRWFPFDPENLGRAQTWFQRYGVWSLLLSWAPLIGDALTFVAGLMRANFGLFLLLTTIGKGARYAILLGLMNGVARLAP